MPYEILEHTADLRIKVKGKNLQKLFRSALEAMAHIMLPNKEKNSSSSKKISLSASDKTSLLIDFLNEVLTNANIEKKVYSEVAFNKLTDNKLDAEIHGFPVDEFKEDIKAVTFHEADIQKNKKGLFETNIVFDI
ncbi:hypothetical protein GF366_03450 [Candidatus Peregrinibacteria bacterium]|nr:hypothetical protein [Candidatus Peregrinibacteria bacterium]